MKRVLPDVWETETETPSPGLTTHAYLLLREGGNVLFYNTANRDDIAQMATLGGVAYQFLSHRDELGASLKTIREKFGAQLGGHVKERDEFERFCSPDLLFEQRETVLDTIEVIPTPGHSPGSTCFLVHSPLGQRYLFTGDTVFRDKEGQWKAGFIPGYSREEDKAALAESLELLKTTQPDVVFSSAFGGDAGYQLMAPGNWTRYLDAALKQLLN